MDKVQKIKADFRVQGKTIGKCTLAYSLLKGAIVYKGDDTRNLILCLTPAEATSEDADFNLKERLRYYDFLDKLVYQFLTGYVNMDVFIAVTQPPLFFDKDISSSCPFSKE